MQSKKGFTLIELLVVIAIIAILAAILFPVFANARDKARQISDLSNLKQIALSTIMYTNDYDDTYPIGESGSNNASWPAPSVWWGGDTTNWIEGIAPYASSINLYYGPNDTAAGQDTASIGFGKKISYGVNSLEDQDPNNGWKPSRIGLFASANYLNDDTVNWLQNSVVCKISEVTQPTSTILLSDLQSVDLDKLTTARYTGGNWVGIGNNSSLAAFSLIGDLNARQWNDGNLQSDFVPGTAGDCWHQVSESGCWAIPNNLRSPSAAYPAGPSGIVSSPFSSKSLTNFAFADGHSKALKPGATNPDNQDLAWVNGFVWDTNNMWIAVR
jgi:prepilin-type N-terminal cleavage/methylation domain-containing protein/prepilin-type processing-associated H-X9-DG protein